MTSRTSNKRIKNLTKYVPIVVGTMALWQGKKADEEHTHKYTRPLLLNPIGGAATLEV